MMDTPVISFPRRAMILAAGRGNRLRPLTDEIPKPLVKVGDCSLLEHHLYKLADLGFENVVINHAWLGDKIESVIGNGDRFGLSIDFSAEIEGGLETAGGIIQALPLLTDGEEPFLVINGDVLTSFDFASLQNRVLQKDCLAHLIMVPTPDFKDRGDFGLQQDLVVSEPQYTFSGLSLLHPKLFVDSPPGFLALAPILRKAIAARQVSGELFQGYWNDVGTLQRLEQARNDCSNGLIKDNKGNNHES